MLTLYRATKVITMNPSHPEAEAVLVREGRIFDYGSQSNKAPCMNAHEYSIDDRFADKEI